MVTYEDLSANATAFAPRELERRSEDTREVDRRRPCSIQRKFLHDDAIA